MSVKEDHHAAALALATFKLGFSEQLVRAGGGDCYLYSFLTPD
jgi:hypothetical protein